MLNADEDFCREALMWKSLKHKFVLPFLGIYETDSATQFFLVSPYMKNGTLSQWRKELKPSVAEIQERVRRLPPLPNVYSSYLRSEK